MNTFIRFRGLVLATFVCIAGLSTRLYASEAIVSEENQVGEQEKVDPSIDQKPDPKAVIPPAGQFPTSLSFYEPGDFYSDFAFLADKSTRTLSVWKLTPAGPQFIEAHPMDFGKVPGDKLALGDKKTPEGIYFFEKTYDGPRLDYNEYGSRAFVMDYPNYFDKRERKTGSGIWLHAIPESKSLLRGSRGCVVVRDEIIKELGKYISLQKTPIVVVDKAEYKPLFQFKTLSTEWKTWLSGWKQAWETKSLQDYLQMYHSDFESQGMDKTAWEKFKAGLNEKYEYIKVKLQQPLVFVHKDEAIVRFLQSYESDANSDFGEKFLYLKKEEGEFKIVGEFWSALSAELLAQTQKEKDRPAN